MTVCYCSKLTELQTQTRVVILQHPRERDKAIGTARMATLCLPGSELLVGVRWDEHPGLANALSDPDRPPALLVPGPDARNVLADPPSRPITLIVVDGTWSQAKNLVRDNPVLKALPRYAFAAPQPSEYRIRKEPAVEFVSTIEALMHVLGALEGDPARFRALLDPFRAMVDAQLQCQALRPERRYRQPRPVRERVVSLPAGLTARFDDLVCVVGEANAWPYHTNKTYAPDELVHWVAIRPSTGETFEHHAAPDGVLSPNTKIHTGLAEDEILRADRVESTIAAFAHFTRPTDVIASWGHYSPNLFIESGGHIAERLDLRALAQRLANKRLGTLETAAAAVGPPVPPLAKGRAGRRLAALAQLVGHWRAAHVPG
jgi:DTW domain-containing protein YfiP